MRGCHIRKEQLMDLQVGVSDVLSGFSTDLLVDHLVLEVVDRGVRSRIRHMERQDISDGTIRAIRVNEDGGVKGSHRVVRSNGVTSR